MPHNIADTDPRLTYAAEQLIERVASGNPDGTAPALVPVASAFLPSRSADGLHLTDQGPDEGLARLVLLATPRAAFGDDTPNDLGAPYLVGIVTGSPDFGRGVVSWSQLSASEAADRLDTALAKYAARLTIIAVEGLDDGDDR